MDFLSSMFDPQNFAGIRGLLNRQQQAMLTPPLLPDQESPLDTAQWPAGPVGAPTGAEARLPANAQPTNGMAPLSLAPPAPAAPPAADDGDWLSGFRGKINDNSNMLLGLASGLLSGDTLGSGLGKGFALAMQGSQLDQKAGSRNLTEQALIKRGLDPATAKSMAANPTLLRGVLPQLFGTADRTNDIKNYEYAVKQGFTGSLADWKAQKGNGGGTEYGLTPIYGTDDQGNTVLGTLGKDGTFKKIDTGGFNVQSGVDKIDLGTRWMLRDKRTGQVVGYEPKDVAGEAEAKKSGALTAERMEALPKARSSLDNALNNMDRLKTEASAIMNDPALGRITGWQGMLPNMPGGDAANVQARLETLKSQVGFSVLQAMRDASQTGGALGQVSNIENVLLQNNLAALDQAQSVEAFKKSLQQIIDYADSAQTRLTNAFRDTYPGQEIKSGATGRKTSSGVGWSVE